MAAGPVLTQLQEPYQASRHISTTTTVAHTCRMCVIRWLWCTLVLVTVAGGTSSRPPNILVFLADDLGIGDLGCYGNTTIKTPNIDRLASEGVKLTHHLAAAPMCTPSRAAVLTGRYPSRYGLVGNASMWSIVITHVASRVALPLDEVTLATALSAANYTTALVGKWHLGSHCDFLGRNCSGPLNYGFHSFFGIPVTLFQEFRGPRVFWKFPLDDLEYQGLAGSWMALLAGVVVTGRMLGLRRRMMVPLLLISNLLMFLLWFRITHSSNIKNWLALMSPWLFRMANSMLLRDGKVVEQPIRLDGLSQRLVQESRQFLAQHANDDRPFFLFHSFAHVHTPMFSAPHMAGVSRHGRYGDNVEEMDESVGAVLDALREYGLEENTIVYFTSDQGGHIEAIDYDGQRIGGHNGRFKGGKAQGGPEGGIRVPGMYRWKGHLPSGTIVDTPTSLMDLMPTLLDLAQLPPMQQLLPEAAHKELDGMSIAKLLTSDTTTTEPRIMLHHCRQVIHAVRLSQGKHVYKMYLKRQRWFPGGSQCGWGHLQGCNCAADVDDVSHQPHLYDLSRDPYEDDDPISPDTEEYQEVVSLLQQYVKEWSARVTYPPSLLNNRSLMEWNPWLQPVCLTC
ncbi:LOW QUALITY PROTEIN: arylsulfatase H-like [Panulirus ornatus]|uniref:LOW QUALITY PROTEIN: arylsulfatase H-like n=1 Tax=Panulirus ornatus TaxID=150431 RepID=UPI003A8797B9